MKRIEYENYTVFVVKAHDGAVDGPNGSIYYKNIVTLQLLEKTGQEALNAAEKLIPRSEYFISEIIQNFRRLNDSA